MVSSRSKTRLAGGMLALASACLGACRVHAEPEPVVGYAEVTSADIETRPYVVYEGRPTYYVDNRWVYRDRGRWVYYREEPPALYRQRPYVQQAPRAPMPRDRGRYAPRTTPPVTAPPAERVQ